MKRTKQATPEKIELTKKFLREGWSFHISASKAGMSAAAAHSLLKEDLELRELHAHRKRLSYAKKITHWWPEHFERYEKDLRKDLLPLGCKIYNKDKKS